MPAVQYPLPKLITELAQKVSYSQLAQDIGVSVGELRRWEAGKHEYTAHEVWKLIRACYIHRLSHLLPTYGVAPLSYNLEAPFDLVMLPVGFEQEPPSVPLINRPSTIAGYPVDFPLGLPASVLATNAKWLEFYARRGFDILTYKTVRTRDRKPNDWPNWIFLKDPPERVDPFQTRIMGELGYFPEDFSTISMANSFGVPSIAPHWWQNDVRRAREIIKEGHQVLIVSVLTSVDRSEEMAADFAEAARLAKEAGADIVEGNFSCPNTPEQPQAGELYHHPENARRVCWEMRAALDSLPGRTPLFIKIGYLPEPDLRQLVDRTWDLIDGIVAINTISARIERLDGQPTFTGKGRETAGVSGWAIRAQAEEVAKHLVALRNEVRTRHRKDLTIISVGGVLTAEDFNHRLAVGVDAVESCTGAFLHPNLGLEIRYDREAAGAESFWREVTHRRAYPTIGESEPEIEFADENARVAWEVSLAVDRIAALLPPEGQLLNAEPITFDPEHKRRGLHAIFTAGTVIGTGREGVLLVPERTRKILDALQIPHKIVSLYS